MAVIARPGFGQPRAIAAARGGWLDAVLSRVTVEVGIYAGLTLLALVLRLALLGDKPLHHDESLHATYTWYLFTGKGYHYDPMMHGPFQFLVTTGIFVLLGVSDFTTRLLPALLGTAIVPLPFFLRKELGRFGALFSAVVLTICPSFLYFSRFYRNDIYIAFFTLGMVVCYFRWLESRRRGWLIGAFALLALSFTAKEVTFITSFIFGIYVLLTLAWEATVARTRPLIDAFRQSGLDGVLMGLAVFAIIFAFFFTTAFTYLPGLHDGVVKGLQYWRSQQPVARGSEPWWYYWSLLLPYEPLEMALAVAGVVLAFRWRTRFGLFLIWWTVLSFGMYTWASEKMPWLILHLLLPIILLAALAIQALARRSWDVGSALAWLGVAIGGLYMVHATVPLSYIHPADPAEMLVYTQTSPDVLTAMQQIDAVALRSGQGSQLQVVVDGDDWWPFVWYLRSYANATVGGPRPNSTVPVLIASDQDYGTAETVLGANYMEEHFKLREWWIPNWQAQSVQNWWNWLMYRRPWNDRGSTDFYLFIRRDLAGGL